MVALHPERCSSSAAVQGGDLLVAAPQEDLLGRLITRRPNIFTSNCILNNFGLTGNVKDPLKFTVK